MAVLIMIHMGLWDRKVW